MTLAATQARSDLPPPREDAHPGYVGPSGFVWLVKGRIGGAPLPGVVHSLDQDLEALQRIGITLAVTLTSEWAPPVTQLAAYGIESLHVPIPDMGAPTLQQAADLCQKVWRALDAGETVLLHCRAGRGRTGTMLAALLIWCGQDFDGAVDRIKAANRNWIESSEQLLFLARFAVWCENARTPQVPQSPWSTADRDVAASPPAATPQPAATWSTAQDDDPSAWPAFATDPRPDPDHRSGSNETINHHQPRKDTTMSLDKTLQTAMSTIPECLASGYVDMETGMLLGIQTIDSHPQEVMDTLAAATADLFQGSAVIHIEQIFKKARGSKSDEHYFTEFLVFSTNLIHVFMRTKRYPNHVCCFVCRKTANPGMVLTKARMSLETVSAAL